MEYVLHEGAMAKLIEMWPEKVKEVWRLFCATKEKQSFFKKSNFSSRFESYDFFSSKEGNQIPFISLIQTL